MERRDLYEDDLTEERYPSPERRDKAAASETLDPDTVDPDEARRVIPKATQGDPDDDDDDEDDDLDDEDDDDDES